MHNPAAQSAVSDALADFAVGAPPDQRVRTIAKQTLDDARQRIATAGDTGHRLGALLQIEDAAPNDARTRAWLLGAILARQTPGSLATPTLAAVIAMGDQPAAAEDDLVEATAIGIEAATRLFAALDSDEYRARWNCAASIGILGATLAISRLQRLDIARTRHALGIAATQAAGLAHNAAHAMAALETGKAAADAIEATLLAKHGFTSAAASIDGRRGFAALMAYRFDTAAIVEGLGTHWTWST
ncbi:MmgE/PrpD family protein [Paraburkholderia sp. HD33-4]|uniref:MmgE/PrpD family protein n=1 Tax=Paraburkholderia sp. HD33-4 TaxID=2883242 RepID=UPI001F223F6A|nr:MmgE/PrpD family protein [Paraburkholderia sp. HD33-4]